MAFTNHSRIAEEKGQKSTDRTRELFAAILLGALIATVGLRSVLPIDALAPAIATLLFALGATTAGVALLCRRRQARSVWLDIAGVVTFVGITVSILIEPDQMVRLVTHSNQPD
ncbi:MAG: hypothetical protein JWR80_6259 [Bradyrhizobium sp.]|nr:hypothetical protein [Bradyrhizobium sp.]